MALDERKRKRVVFGLLIGAIIFGLIMKPWESRGKRGSDDSSDGTEQISMPPATVDVATYKVETGQQTLAFAATWPADPFLQPQVEVTPSGTTDPVDRDNGSSKWRLQGIMTMNGEQTCVIDGQMCTLGSTINGWRVSHIGSTEVRLEQGARTIRLALP